jgi:hypothetical protein
MASARRREQGFFDVDLRGSMRMTDLNWLLYPRSSAQSASALVSLFEEIV